MSNTLICMYTAIYIYFKRFSTRCTHRATYLHQRLLARIKDAVVTSFVAGVGAIAPLERTSVVEPISYSFSYCLHKMQVHQQQKDQILRAKHERTKRKRRRTEKNDLVVQLWRVSSEPGFLHFSLAMCIARVDE